VLEAVGAWADTSAGVSRHAATKRSTYWTTRAGKLKRGKGMMFSLHEDGLAFYS
jgi:hypothetical protein